MRERKNLGEKEENIKGKCRRDKENMIDLYKEGECKPISGVANHMVELMYGCFALFRNLYTDLHRGWTSFHSY